MVKKTGEMNRWVLGNKRALVNHYVNVQDSWVSPSRKGWEIDELGICAACGGQVLQKELRAYGGNCGSCAGF